MAKAELTGTDKERARANLAYWEKREKAQAAAYQLEEDELARRVQARYNYLLTEIDARINDFYQRFAKAEGITMNLAEMAVSKMDVQAYNARAAQLVKDRDFSPKANQELRLYNATMRINRLEMLKSRIGLELVDTYQQLEDEFGEAFRTRCTEEYARQAGILGQSTNVMPQKDIERILTADFNNANWSSRLWANQGALRDRISELLTNGIIQGRSVRVMAKDLQELLIDPSASNALRLLRTEMNRVQTEAQMASFRDNGYRQYMFISTEDSQTCSQCAHLNGEIFDVDDPEALKPPQHPNCRCSTAAYMDRDELERKLFGEKIIVDKTDEFGIIKSGAISGARNPYGKAAEEHAERYYGLVRSMTTDVQKIAKTSGLSETIVKSIKDYIFLEKHDLGGDKPEYFHPDYMMAESWRRLQEGKPEPHDLTLLYHEKMEQELVRQGLSQQAAHIETSKKYNYSKEADEFYGKIKKYRKE